VSTAHCGLNAVYGPRKKLFGWIYWAWDSKNRAVEESRRTSTCPDFHDPARPLLRVVESTSALLPGAFPACCWPPVRLRSVARPYQIGRLQLFGGWTKTPEFGDGEDVRGHRIQNLHHSDWQHDDTNAKAERGSRRRDRGGEPQEKLFADVSSGQLWLAEGLGQTSAHNKSFYQ